jgi:Chlorophyll A-B binding protein
MVNSNANRIESPILFMSTEPQPASSAVAAEDTDTQTNPTATDTPKPPSAFGWTQHAERLNGRFAMVGFIALLLLELWTRQDFFTWLGMP